MTVPPGWSEGAREELRARSRGSGERGSASLVTAAVLVAVMILGLGAADVARVLVAAARAQTAADASALASAQSLAFPTELEPAAAAETLARLNGARLRSCTCEPPSFEARVAVEVPVGPLFLSSDDRTAVAEARAVVEVPDI